MLAKCGVRGRNFRYQTMKSQTVPVIDIGAPGDRHEVAAQIDRACRNWGFFQIIDHGIEPPLFDKVRSETKKFFALPKRVKESLSRSRDNARGYYNRELTKNIRDMKEVFDFARTACTEQPENHPANRTPDGYNQWPEANLIPGFKPAMLEYYRACETVALSLLRTIAKGLGVAAEELTRDFENDHSSFVRLNYYPTTDPLAVDNEAGRATDTGHLGVHHHTDAGALTLLLQDNVGGLQVCRDGEWFAVDPVSDALVVNIGDVMQVWTNDLYRAPRHRVLASRGQGRYSIPFFYNPSYDAVYHPLDKLTSEESPARYSPINWGEFRHERQQGDYANYGVEIQISDFRT